MSTCPPVQRPASRLRAAALAILGVFGVAAGFDPAMAASPPAADSIFGTKELHSTNLNMFPKWRDALQRFQAEMKNCGGSACRTDEWLAFLDKIRDLPPEEQIRAVNREMNDKPYVTDPVNWHMADYWATPLQFLRKDGDCEDYAISKYFTLKALGVPVDDMRVVALQDQNLNLGHAVLVVYVGDEPMLLDNQIASVVPANSIRHYNPVFSINEAGWWLHRR